jgi:hypothetical protein
LGLADSGRLIKGGGLGLSMPKIRAIPLVPPPT